MKISILQDVFLPGAPENVKKIRNAYKKAVEAGADMLVLPRGAADSAPARDLVKFTTANTALAFTTSFDEEFHAPAILLALDGQVHSRIPASCSRMLQECVFEYKGRNILLTFFDEEICPVERYGEIIEKIDLGIFMDSRPFLTDREDAHKARLQETADSLPAMMYVAQAGGYETQALRGASSCWVEGGLALQMPYFESGFATFDTESKERIEKNEEAARPQIALIHDAIVRVIADYFKHCNTTKAVIGLSGGIDSSVVMPLAVEALGRQNVFGIMMPSQFSTDHSVKDAVDLAENLQIHYEIIPIKPLYDVFMQQLKPVFGDLPFGLAEENLQARIRGNLLMATANKHGAIVLNTSNKSEAVCGYGTLYGDLCGGLSVLGDLYKSQVYALAHYINRKKEIVPQNSITKAPSAELRPGQKDSDSLPDYDLIEKIMRLHLEQHLDEKALIGEGCDEAAVKRVLGLFVRNEYKRRQTPPIVRLSTTCLGADVRLPL